MNKLNKRSGGSYEQIGTGTERAVPIPQEHSGEIQPWGKIARLPIGLDEQVCAASVTNLNQVLADTMTLRDLYKKHSWQASGHAFFALRLLFDKHHTVQSELVEKIAERIQSLGGVSIAMAYDVIEVTILSRPPRGREESAAQLTRLLKAHQAILYESRSMARQASEVGDDGTNDLLVSDLIRTNEVQAWYVAEHLATQADSEDLTEYGLSSL